MPDYFMHMGYMHWLGFAVLMLIIEILTGTGLFLWISACAAVVGGAAFLFASMSIEVQCLVFAVLIFVSFFLWKGILFTRTSHLPNKFVLNRRADQYIGRVFTLDSPLINGMGKIHVDDTVWRIQCEINLPAGSSVSVVGAEGIILVVKPTSQQ